MEPRATAPPTEPQAPPPSPPWAPPFGSAGGGRVPPAPPGPLRTGGPGATSGGGGRARHPGRARLALVGGVAATAMLAGSVGGWLASSAHGSDTPSAVAVDRASVQLDGADLDVGEVLARVEPSVVSVETEIASTGGPWGSGGTATGAGTGIVLDTDGFILTNAHVIEGATSITVTVPGSSPPRTATVVNADTRGRPRPAPGVRHDRPGRGAARLVGRPAGRRRRGRHRQRPGPRRRADRHRGHRVGHRSLARDRVRHPARPHPDRCRHQLRQLGRPARERGRSR